MKHIRTICLATALFTSLSGFALTATTNGVTWTYSVVNGGARISGGSPTSGALTIPSKLGEYDVTSIGDEAFRNCSGLTSVTIPNSVKNIGTSAFRASGLRSVAFGGGITNIGNSAFYGCSSLKNIEIPNSVRRIETQAFHSSGLTNVTISSGVERIWPSAFRECRALKNVVIKRGLGYMGNYVFYGCSNLENLTFEGDSPKFGDPCDDVFTGVPSDFCVYVSRGSTGWGVTIPGTWHGVSICYMSYKVRFDANGGTCAIASLDVERGRPIGTLPVPTRNSGESGTFLGWFTAGGEEVTENTVVNADMTIYAHWSPIWRYSVVDGKAAVIGYSLSEGALSIPTEIDGYPVVAVAANAFNNCQGLTSVTIPNCVTNIGAYAFSGCSGMESFVVGEGHPAFCSVNGMLLSKDGETLVRGVNGDVSIPDGVMKIDDCAFDGRSGLTGVTIPNSVTNIGAYAFSGCSGLRSLRIINVVTSIGNGAFEGCSGLESVEIPQCVCTNQLVSIFPDSYQTITNVVIADGVTNIGDYTFDSCTNLTNVTIPEGVTSIGSSAFDGCSGLTSVTMPESVTNIGSSAFSGCNSLSAVYITDVASWCGISFGDSSANPLCYAHKLYLDGFLVTDLTIPEGVTHIGSYAFDGCSGLTSVTMPESVMSIGAHAFEGCGGLVDMTISDSVTNIGDYAFSDCNGLVGVTIPNGVRRIGSYAFYNCKNLTGTMAIPDGVESIEDLTFCNCIGLTGIAIPNSVTNIGISAFRGCKSLPDVAIPRSVTRIGATAFWGCGGLRSVNVTDIAAWCNIVFGNTYANPLRYARNLYLNGSPITDLTIPDGVTNIGSNSFHNCTNFLNVTIPSGVREIGSYSFYGCSGLTSVTIPDSVTNIGTYAFYSCLGLTEMTFCGNAPLVGTSIFTSGSPCTAYVRRASTGWGVTIPGRWNGIAIDYVHYAVTMDANGGTCETASLDVREGSSVGALPEPTWGNAVFLGWFTEVEGGVRVDESLIVTEPIMLHAHWLTEVARPVIVSDLGAVFRADSCKVSITSETEGATIYYTDDGTTPKRYDDYLYAGPVTITDTTTFKAVAVVGGLRSAYTTVTITKHNLTLGEALNVGEGVALATNPVLPWQPIYDSHAKLGDATARSSVIGNRTNTWLSATVSGAGTMTFWYKVSCEHDGENNLFTCDRLMVYTNDVEITDWRMDGETGWAQRELTFAGGENTVKWVYYKDKSDSAGEDCAWVDGITWTSSGADAGLAAWLAERNLTVDAQAANGRTAAECYALGLDPSLATNDFRIVSIEMVDGKPKVEWEPKTNRWTGAEIQAVLKGAAALEGPWADVPAGGNPAFRFFKVVVVVP